MKKSKLFPLVLALILVLAAALPITASAAGTAKITVEYPAGYNLSGHTFMVYKIFDVTYLPDPTDPLNPQKGSYSYTLDPASPWNGFTDYPSSGSQTLLQYLSSGYPVLDDSPLVNEIATNMWNYVNNTSITADATASGVSHSQQVIFYNLDPGYYLVYSESTIADNVDIVAACSLITATSEITVTPKVDFPTIADLKMWNHSSATPANKDVWSSLPLVAGNNAILDPSTDDWRNWTDVSIGDTVTSRVRSTVPVMTAYEIPSNTYGYDYILHVELGTGLTFLPASVEVRVGGVPADGKYYISGTNIVFRPEEFVKFTPGALIEIRYDAMLNGSATIGAPGNTNTVWLEFSTDPYDSAHQHGETAKMGNKVYTFQFELFKFHGANLPLANTEFVLNQAGHAMRLVVVTEIVSASDTVNPNVYRVATPSETPIAAMKTPPSGKIIIEGLDAGTYSLTETKAPDGFNKLDNPFTIVITHTDSAGAYSMTVDGVSATVVNVENFGGPILPSTGGVGTTLFYAFSAVLTAGLAVFFISRRRKKILNG